MRQRIDGRKHKSGGRPIPTNHGNQVYVIEPQQVGIEGLPPLVDQFSELEASPTWVAFV